MSADANADTGRGEWPPPAVFCPLLILAALGISAWMHDYRVPSSDEGAILTQAAKILRGGVYYRDIDAYPFPAASYALALGMAIFGEHIAVARAGAALVYCGILLGVYGCAYRLLGAARAAVIGVALLSFKFLAWPALSNYFYWDFSFGFACAAIALLLFAQRAGRPEPLHLLLAGVAVGVAFSSKQSVGIYLGGAAVCVLVLPRWFTGFAHEHFSAGVRNAATFTAGMAIPIVPMVIYFALQGVLLQMVYSGLIRPFVSYLPTSAIEFAAPLRWWEFGAFEGVPGMPYLIEPLWTMLQESRMPVSAWYSAYWALGELFSRALYSSVALAFAWAAVSWARALRAGTLAQRGSLYAYALLAAAVVFSAFPRADYPHVISVYPLVLVLLFALWGGLPGTGLGRAVRSIEAGLAALLLVCALYLTAVQQSFLTHRISLERADLRVAPRTAWVESVVRYIEDEVGEDESLLVYGHEAFYYFLTGRFYPWPFVQLYPGQAGGDKGRSLAEMLASDPPRLVLQGMIAFPGMPYLPDYAPLLDSQLHARYTRDMGVFRRYPPKAGRAPRKYALAMYKPRYPAARRGVAAEIVPADSDVH